MSCRYCGSENLKPLISHEAWLDLAQSCADERHIMANLVRANKRLDFGDIVLCGDCGLSSVTKPPSDEALGAFYKAYYANKAYGDKAEKKLRRNGARFAKLKKKLGSFEGRKPRFLDVGCNVGYAVEAARRLGFDAEGIDVDAESVEMAQDRYPEGRYFMRSIHEHAAAGHSYDLVHCTEVIEHVVDFKSFARDLAKLVAKGGLLFLTTPDAGHWRRPANLVTWNEVKPPEHLQWFRKSHLRELFAKEGLNVSFAFNLKPGIKMVAKRV